MRKWLGVLFGVLACVPFVARAGFDIDPAVEKALTPAPAKLPALSMASLSSASAAAPSVSAPLLAPTVLPTQSQAMSGTPHVGAAAPSPAIASTPLTGPSNAWNEIVKGFARNEPAKQALSHLMPAGGRLVVNTPIATSSRVSWQGDESRLTIARKILVDAKLDGHFEGDNLVIGVVDSVSPQLTSVTHSGDVSRLWTMPKGVMLSDGLADWIEQISQYGSRYRWTLDWDAYDGPSHEQRVDYKIVAPLRFTGTIDEAAVQLILLYKRAPKPLHIDVNKQQRLIHITLKGQN